MFVNQEKNRASVQQVFSTVYKKNEQKFRIEVNRKFNFGKNLKLRKEILTFRKAKLKATIVVKHEIFLDVSLQRKWHFVLPSS